MTKFSTALSMTPVKGVPSEAKKDTVPLTDLVADGFVKKMLVENPAPPPAWAKWKEPPTRISEILATNTSARPPPYVGCKGPTVG